MARHLGGSDPDRGRGSRDRRGGRPRLSRGTKEGGEAVDLWFRNTLCLKRTSDGWRIVREHASVPFYMDGSLRAAVDLTPNSDLAWNAAPR